MRVIVTTAIVLAVISPSLSFAERERSEYCIIPKLEAGVATTVEVPYIDMPFCGTAVIDKRYVRVSDIAKATDEEEANCVSDNFCTKVLRIYRDQEKATSPYILIFHGPKNRSDA